MNERLENRLAQLERTNRRLTAALMALSIAFGSAVTMGSVAGPGPVEGTSFTLRDKQGKKRAVLEVTETEESVFQLFDQKDMPQVRMIAEHDVKGGRIIIGRPKQKASILLSVTPTERAEFTIASQGFLHVGATGVETPSMFVTDENNRHIGSWPPEK